MKWLKRLFRRESPEAEEPEALDAEAALAGLCLLLAKAFCVRAHVLIDEDSEERGLIVLGRRGSSDFKYTVDEKILRSSRLSHQLVLIAATRAHGVEA